VQLTRGNLALIVGLLLVLAVGGVTVAARSGGDGAATLRIESLANPAPAGAGRGAARQVPTPAPTPPPPKSVFETHQVVAYYGNPYSATMGILGEYQGDELVQRVKAQAAKHQQLNSEKTVIAALHLVYAVAQARPGADGSYITHMPDEMVEGLIEQTRANGMLLFIDLQNGRLNPVEEAQRVRKWLVNEHVHLAVDPEFTFRPGETPQEDIGQIDASVINGIQDVLQEVAEEARTGNKILIVHQFRPDMIENKPLIARDRDRVDVVLNMDGWGQPANKLSKYQAHVTNEPVEYAGIKLFYRWDKPLLTEAEIQQLTPRPNYIQYQ
jgi:hypothetical protein